MTTYHASHHAVDRLTERFPVLAPIAGIGSHAAIWLARSAPRAQVAGQQCGHDLMLVLDLPLVTGPLRLYLPVTPMAGDAWTIRTVLTEEQGMASLAAYDRGHAEGARQTWRARKGFTRPWQRREARTALVAIARAA